MHDEDVSMKKAFTLIELLVVLAILGILMSVLIFVFTKAPDTAEKAKCEEYVKQVATALETVEIPPPLLHQGANNENGLDEKVAVPIAEKLGCKTKDGRLTGYDRFGIVTPWAMTAIKNQGSSCSLSSEVNVGSARGTIKDHRLRYALGRDGEVTAMVGGETVRIRANAVVWCGGADGVIEPYSKGVEGDDVYSWSPDKVIR